MRATTDRRLLQLVSVLWLVLLCGWCPAQAATIIVDATADDTTVNGNCTLRQAVIAANTDAAVDACAAGSGADVITVPAGTYLLTLVGAGEDAAATGDLDVTADVDIQGAGAATTIVDGNLADRVFDFDPGAGGIAARLAGVTVRNGAEVSEGAGIRTGGTLTVEDSTVTSNAASGDSIARGGGIRSSGDLAVLHSTVVNNITNVVAPPITSQTQGGGIYSDGSVTIIASTIDGNTVTTDFTFFGAAIEGGGLYFVGSLTIRDSTISNNTASAPLALDPFSGGIHSANSSLTLTNSTVSGNITTEVGPGMAIGSGAGVGLFGGTAAISNSTITDNFKIIQEVAGLYSDISVFGATATFRNTVVFACEDFFAAGTVIADAYNLVRYDSCGFSGTDLVGVDPLLVPLQNNGGPTFTHALLPLSPAREAGSPAVPGSGGNACEAADQRGVSRPQFARCDIGSFEVEACPTTPLAGCDTPAKSLLLIKDRDADGAGAKDKLIWKWLKGPATVQADFGNPTATTNYTLCVYAGATTALAAWVPGGDTCGSAPCWKTLGSTGYRRSDPAAGAGGLAKIILKGGASAKIIAKGKGSGLDLDADTLPLPVFAQVLVQLSNSANANCWQSTFPPASVKKNSDTLYKAKTP